MFANCSGPGMNTGFPDVCLTPAPPAPSPVPIPYPNLAPHVSAVGAKPTVLFGMKPAHNMMTTIPITNGDEPGVALGVASGTVKGPSRHLAGAATFLLKGAPATRLTSPSLQNSTNCPGVSVAPDQTKVVILAP